MFDRSALKSALKPRVFLCALGGLAIAFSAPSLAQEADGLGCMEASYSAEENAELESLFSAFAFDGGTGNDAANQLSAKAAGSTISCSEEMGWGEETLLPAIMYEIGRLSEQGYRRSGSMSLENQEKLDSALADGEHSSLWASLEKAVVAGMKGEQPELTSVESLAMGLFILGSGLEAEDAEKAGELLGFLSLQRYGLREFANIQAGGEPVITLD